MIALLLAAAPAAGQLRIDNYNVAQLGVDPAQSEMDFAVGSAHTDSRIQFLHAASRLLRPNR